MNGRHLTIVLAVLALLPLLYVASYLCLLTPDDSDFSFGIGGGRVRRRPYYRVGGKVAKAFFAPLNAFDHKLRPIYWDSGWSDQTSSSSVRSLGKPPR